MQQPKGIKILQVRCLLCHETLRYNRDNTRPLIEHLKRRHPYISIARLPSLPDCGNQLYMRSSGDELNNPTVNSYISMERDDTWQFLKPGEKETSSLHLKHGPESKNLPSMPASRQWLLGGGKLFCNKCGSQTEPVMERNENKNCNHKSMMGKTCFFLWWCWPLSYMAYSLCADNTVKLICKKCSSYLATYDLKTKKFVHRQFAEKPPPPTAATVIAKLSTSAPSINMQSRSWERLKSEKLPLSHSSIKIIERVMDESHLEECEEDAQESCVPEEVVPGATSRRQWPISRVATGVYIDLLRKATEEEKAEELTLNPPEPSPLATSSTADPVRLPVTPVSESQGCSGTITEIQPSFEMISLLQEPQPEVYSGSQNLRSENQQGTVEGSGPPSYTSLPPPVPVIDLPSIITHSPPPPSYEQTFGLRYLDRDEPVLVLNTQDMWGHRPQLAYCSSCNAMVLTSVHTECCQATHFAALLSFIFCCWPCCILPYLVPVLKEVHHHCPACNGHLGAYQPFSQHGE